MGTGINCQWAGVILLVVGEKNVLKLIYGDSYTLWSRSLNCNFERGEFYVTYLNKSYFLKSHVLRRESGIGNNYVGYRGGLEL